MTTAFSFKSEALTTRQASELLGLSTTSVQKMVEAGELAAWTTPGGHRRIHKAAVEKMLLQRAPASPAPKQGEVQMRVLLADDDPVAATQIEALMAQCRLSVELTIARDASTALVQLERQRPDLVISELFLQSFDGFHLIDIIERDLTYYSIDLIVISALDERLVRNKGIPAWASYYQKPFDQSRFMGYLDSMRARVIKKTYAR